MLGVESLDSVAHVIQLALTPVFLLSGIAALLNVFAQRLARVADRVDKLSESVEADPTMQARIKAQQGYLRRRSRALDAAVVLGAVAGAATCAATLTLLVGALRDHAVASILFGLFGLAVVATFGALVAFMFEMLMASRGLRRDSSKAPSGQRLS